MKPRITRTVQGTQGPQYDVNFDNGKTGKVWQSETYEWRYHLDDDENAHPPCCDKALTFDLITVAAYLAGGIELEPIVPMTADQARAIESGPLTEYTKKLRKLLKQRTGRAWSVNVGRGTAYCWVKIKAPPARLNRWSMTPEDQAMLQTVTGEDADPSGISLPPTRGYQAALLLHVANR